LASTKGEGGPRRAPSLPDLQRDMILRAFEESQHNLSKAAIDLGIPRSTLRARLRRYGVR
jgi:transcriptional regulator of acetoin/glycerol metabolism